MGTLEKRWKALQRQLTQLGRQARRAQGVARKRMKRLERQTRVKMTRAYRTAEPQVRQVLTEAERVGRSVRAGVKAGAAAYRASGRKRA
ncbi:MAG TPA: hypothetical protein VMQ51_16600 [Candidatus Binatia bacterium]|nr:hypothetical protein [Candidatus Binatia bacterium]